MFLGLYLSIRLHADQRSEIALTIKGGPNPLQYSTWFAIVVVEYANQQITILFITIHWYEEDFSFL